MPLHALILLHRRFSLNRKVLKQTLPWPASLDCLRTRKKVVTTANRCEGVYNRTGEPVVSSFGPVDKVAQEASMWYNKHEEG